jgi:hypothetical protein
MLATRRRGRVLGAGAEWAPRPPLECETAPDAVARHGRIGNALTASTPRSNKIDPNGGASHQKAAAKREKGAIDGPNAIGSDFIHDADGAYNLGRVDKGDSQSVTAVIQGWKLGASHDPRPDRHRSLGADRPIPAA